MGGLMPRYYVKMRIDFDGEIEADSMHEAEQLAYTSWGDSVTDDISYDGVYSIDVEEIEDEDEDEDEEKELTSM
jgi:hypothetical protein